MKDPNDASSKASAASAWAMQTRNRTDYKVAADAHREAAAAHAAAGNDRYALFHNNRASEHDAKAENLAGKPVRGQNYRAGSRGGQFYVTATGRKVYKSS